MSEAAADGDGVRDEGTQAGRSLIPQIQRQDRLVDDGGVKMKGGVYLGLSGERALGPTEQNGALSGDASQWTELCCLEEAMRSESEGAR